MLIGEWYWGSVGVHVCVCVLLTAKTRSSQSGWSDCSSPGSCTLYRAWAATLLPNATVIRGTIWKTEMKAHTNKFSESASRRHRIYLHLCLFILAKLHISSEHLRNVIKPFSCNHEHARKNARRDNYFWINSKEHESICFALKKEWLVWAFLQCRKLWAEAWNHTAHTQNSMGARKKLININKTLVLFLCSL